MSEYTDFRIGHGYDVHRLCEGRRLIIGGVNIPHSVGLLGHSDADVLLHAIIDAVLGALALGDIGHSFPDTDEKYKDIDSTILAKRTAELMLEKGFVIGNIDSTVIAQSPKLAPYIDQMKDNIAKAFYTDSANVNVKATTEEGLGFTGAKEGIAAHAVVILRKKK